MKHSATISGKNSNQNEDETERLDEVDITEVSNEVEVYFPARHIRFNVQNSKSGSNTAEGVKSKISDTESG